MAGEIMDIHYPGMSITAKEQERLQINPHDFTYHRVMRAVTNSKYEIQDRTGVGTRFLPAAPPMYFDLRYGFPAITTKSLYMHGVSEELGWFLRGETNIRSLVLERVNIWNEWPFVNWLRETGRIGSVPQYSEEWHRLLNEFRQNIMLDIEFANMYGNLGPIYGKQWVARETTDGQTINQVENAITLLKDNPFSRRIIVDAWNPQDIPYLSTYSLPPCHALYQFNVDSEGGLHTTMYQRSADLFLGVPFNIASYALLTHLITLTVNKDPRSKMKLTPGSLTIYFGNAHIYLNHIEQVEEQLSRDSYTPPTLIIEPSFTTLYNFNSRQCRLARYQHHPRIKAPIAV